MLQFQGTGRNRLFPSVFALCQRRCRQQLFTSVFAGLVSPNVHQTPMHLFVLCLPPLKCVTRAGTLWLLHLHRQSRAGAERVLDKHSRSGRNQERGRNQELPFSSYARGRGRRFPSHSLGGCTHPYLLSGDCRTHAKENQRHRGPGTLSHTGRA